MLALLLCLGLPAPAALVKVAQEGAPRPSFAVRAKHIRLLGDQVLDDGVLVVEDGRITAVHDAKKAGAFAGETFEHDGWLSAGLIACRSASGSRGETIEWKRSVTPDTRFADVIDFAHPDFQRALDAGVTTMVLAPAPLNVVNGLTAVVKTHGGQILSREGHMVLSFSSLSLRANRAPTSYAGALDLLERRLEKPDGAWQRVADADLPVILETGSRDEIQRALAFAQEHKLSGALSHANDAVLLAPEVKRSGLGVIVGPFAIGVHPRSLESVVALAHERVPIAFAADSPLTSDQGLRLSAAICIRAGLDPALAWDGLTSTAAQIAGVGSHVGRLAKGYDADFVLWTGDPLDLSSRPVGVYVGGRFASQGSKE